MDDLDYGNSENYGITRSGVAYGDAQTRGQLRHWKKQLAARYAIFNNTYVSRGRLTPVVLDMVSGSRSTRIRAFERLQETFGGAGAMLESKDLTRGKAIAIWSIMKPRSPVAIATPDDTPAGVRASLAQDCVTVNYIVAGACKSHAIIAEGLWTLEVPDHALGRAVERSQFLTPGGIIREAHLNLLGLPVMDAKKLEYLRAGPGCFAGLVSVSRDVNTGASIHFRAKTWLAEDTLGDDQKPLSEPGPVGRQMRNSIFMPRPLWPLA